MEDTSNPAYKDAPYRLRPTRASSPRMPPGSSSLSCCTTALSWMRSRSASGGIEPQKAFEALKANKLGALDYAPHPRATLECGSYSNPDGCKDKQADSKAAHAQALLWYVTGDSAYAQNAVKIMDAWAGTPDWTARQRKRRGASILGRRRTARRRGDREIPEYADHAISAIVDSRNL